MERESLNVGLLTMMNALDQVRGALHEIIIPTSQVSARSSSFFKYFCVFVFLIPVFFLDPCCSQSEQIPVPP